jgi:hypothetical protein
LGALDSLPDEPRELLLDHTDQLVGKIVSPARTRSTV